MWKEITEYTRTKLLRISCPTPEKLTGGMMETKLKGEKLTGEVAGASKEIDVG